MAVIYDPNTKKYIDDGTGDPYADGMYSGNMFMPGFTGDYNKYGLEPYEQADMNQQFSGLKSMLQILSDPMFNMMVANGDPTADTYDFGALNPGGGVTYGGGATAGGAAGTGAVGNMAAYTPTLTSSLTSSDPLLSDYAKRLQAGESPYTLQLELTDPSSGITNQGTIDTYTNAINRMAAEMQTAATQTAKLTPQQAWYAGTGMPNPNETYSADHLPDSVLQGLGPEYQTQMQGYADTYEKAMKAFDQADNRYVDLDQRDVTAAAPRGPGARAGDVLANLPGVGGALAAGGRAAEDDTGVAGGVNRFMHMAVPFSNAAGPIGRAVGDVRTGTLRDLPGAGAVAPVLGAVGGAARSAEDFVPALGIGGAVGRFFSPGDESGITGKLDLGGADPATATAGGRGMPLFGGGAPAAGLGPSEAAVESDRRLKPPKRKPLDLGPLGIPNPNGKKPPRRKPLDLTGPAPEQAAVQRASLAPPSWLSSDSPTVDGQLLTGRVRVAADSPEAKAANRGGWGSFSKNPGGTQMLATTQQGQQDSQARVAAQRVYEGQAGGDQLVRQILAQEMAKRGRSPASDRQAAQLRALRSFGIQI